MIITCFLLSIIVYLAAATAYLLVLAVSYFFTKENQIIDNTNKINSFAVLVPAHNEEILVSIICQSLLKLRYPVESYKIYVIADNCNDKTVAICKRYPVNVLIRNDKVQMGKGYAIDFGLKNIQLDSYDAVLIIDADNYVDENILVELNKLLKRGEQAIQCYNTVGNRNESWFTQLLYVSRTINNILYHFSKYKLGLSSYLMGNGICFTTQLLKEKGWTAFSIGEDWEYYAQLLNDRIRIAFAAHAKVYHQESKSLNQATSQRLRWSSGRFFVVKRFGIPLLCKGIGSFDWLLIDASLPLLFPNYSLMINLTFLTFFAVLAFSEAPYRNYMLVISSFIMFGQIMLFMLGIILSGKTLKILKAVCFAPLFLFWKMMIDIVSFTGLYRGKSWVRTRRHKSS